jgi:hypothetical protein
MKIESLVPQQIPGTLSQESNIGIEPSIMVSSTPQSTKSNLYVPAEKLLELNTYVNYYKATEIQTDDNPMAGILLETNKKNGRVEFATASMKKNLFVSKCLWELPKKELFEAFINNELLKWNN